MRILPPGIEKNQYLYGNLYFCVGDLAWLKTSFPPENTKIRIVFWGQKGEGRVIVAKNAAEELKNYYVSELEYEIRCPVLLFQKYLQDMVRLRIDILDKRNDKVIGNVYINMLLFLKNNPKAFNTPIEDIKGLFPIYKIQTSCNKPKESEKIGEIEFEMNVRFLKQPLLKILPNQRCNMFKNHKYKKYSKPIFQSQFKFVEKKNQTKFFILPYSKNFIKVKQEKQKNQIIQRRIVIQKQLIIKIEDPTKQNLDSSFLYHEMKTNTNNQESGVNNQQYQQVLIQGQNKSIQDDRQIGNQQQQMKDSLQKIQEKQINQQQFQEQQTIDNKYQQQIKQSSQSVETASFNSNKNGKQNQKVNFEQQSIIQSIVQQDMPLNSIEQPPQREEFQSDDQNEVSNIQLQKILKEKQNELYLNMLSKQQEKMMERSMHFDDFPILSPELELLKLRMDEAELISGLTAGVFSELANVPPEGLPEKENLDLNSANGYAFQADSFQVTNLLFKKKLSKSQIFLTILVPTFEFGNDGNLKIFYDQLYVTCRRQLLLEQYSYEFNQSFPCKLQLNEQTISQFTNSRIYFTIHLGEEGQEQRIEFAKGEFRFDQLLLKPYLRGTFEIPMFPTQNFVVQGKGNNTTGQAGNTQKLIGKNNITKSKNFLETSNTNQQINSIPAGELIIQVALLNNLSPYAEQLTTQLNAVQKQKQQLQEKQTVKRQKQISNIQDMQFQIILVVTSLTDMQRSISVNDQILIRHKIYGRMENLEGFMNSMDFATKQVLFNYKSIMPVDQNSLQKMNNTPFFLEIWKKNKINPVAFAPSGAENLLGIIRFNLKQIPELLQNPLAFSSNLYPTMLVDGEMPIWDPQSNRNIGICNVSFAFGTVQQVHFFDQKITLPQIVNQISLQGGRQDASAPSQSQQQAAVPKNTKQVIVVDEENPYIKHQQQLFLANQKSQGVENSSQIESQSEHIGGSEISQDRLIQITKFKMIRFDGMEYSKETINRVFVLVMENIRRNKRRAQNILRNFILKAEKHEKRVTLREFYNFLNDIPIQEALNIKNGYLHKLISVLDFEESGEINTTDFVKSYNSFLNYEDILRDSYSNAIKEFSLILINKSFNVSDFERILLRFSEFGFVKREHFKNILDKDLECDHLLINRLIDLLDIHEDGLIQSNLLPDYLRNMEVYEKLNYIYCDSPRYAELVKQNLQENLLKNEEGLQELIMNDELADKEINVRDIQYLIQGLGLDISFWEAACVIESIRLQLNIPITDPQDEFKLPFVYLSDWLQYIIKQKKEDPQFNYFTYLVEQRNRIIEEQLINNQLSERGRDKGQKHAPNSQRNQQQFTENSSHKYIQQSQLKNSSVKQQNEDDEEDLIQLVKNNYKKL